MEVLFGNLEEYGLVVYTANGKLYMIGDRETTEYEDTPEMREKVIGEAKAIVKEWLFG